MTEKKLSFEEARQLQFELLIELDRFCKQNGLTYFLAYGSLLGAVRHGGFIPWDDDIDVIMPLQDIDKLEHIYKSERYSVITCRNNKEFAYSFARLYDNNTFTKCGKFRALGVGIDIYPMVNAPSKNQDLYIKKMFKYVPIRRFLIRLRSFLVNRGLWLGNTLDFKLLNFFCQKKLNQLMESDKQPSPNVYISSGERDIINKSLFYPVKKIMFNDRCFTAPSDIDKLLTIWYGDYMQLPPEDKRKPYHLGNMYIKY